MYGDYLLKRLHKRAALVKDLSLESSIAVSMLLSQGLTAEYVAKLLPTSIAASSRECLNQSDDFKTSA